MIDFHFSRTPNCWKVVIALHELGQEFNIIEYDLLKGDHLTPQYGQINPNHKVPAIIDRAPADGGEPITVAESGAILVYLAEKFGMLLPQEPRQRSRVLQWLAWQISAYGPMAGQVSHFIRYAPVRHEYSVQRFSNELTRLTHVLERNLAANDYVAGEYSIADIAIWPMTSRLEELGVEAGEFPNIARWVESVRGRDAVAKLFADPRTALDPSIHQKSRRLTDEEWSNIYGDHMLEAVKNT